MFIEYSFDEDFKKFFKKLDRQNYSHDLRQLDGIGEQLDLNEFSKQFFSTKKTADVSVDSNANVSNVTVTHYNNELVKPLQRLNAYYRLWKEGRRIYNDEFSQEALTKQFNKEIYINDFTGFNGMAYCYNFSCMDIVCQGVQFGGHTKSEPPKHISSFIGQMVAFLTYACNQILGAVGLSDLLICTAWYVEKLFEENPTIPREYLENQIKQELQAFLFQVNQPFRSSLQSPFSNISIYDDGFLTKLCNEYIFPDGRKVKKETVKYLQNIFLDLKNSTMEKTLVTFPLTTACFSINSDKDILDEDFLDFIAKKNLPYQLSSIFGGETSVLSSCCFDKNQKVLCKSSNKGILYDTFENIYNLKPYNFHKKNFTVFHNGSWIKGNLIKTKNIHNSLIKLKTSNNKEFLVTSDHIVPSLNGNKQSKDITTEDYILFNNLALDSYPEKDKRLSYEQGFLIGLYIGDGSKYKRKDSNSYEVTLSLNINDESKLYLLSKALLDWNISEKFHKNFTKNNVMFIKIYSKKLYNIINNYVIGDYAHEKKLNLQLLLQSKTFRNGIIDGWYQSDGGNSNRIYTTSKILCEHGELLFTSVGLNTVIDISDRIGKNNVIIRGKTFDRNYPLYCIRWYNGKNKRSMDNVYIVKNNSIYFKIVSKSIQYYNDDVYCFEMKNINEQYFTLPNGHITHNCRLRSDGNKEYFNQFGSGSTKIGSQNVVTLNLPRLAYLAKNDGAFFSHLRSNVILAGKINNVKRNIIKKRVEEGHLPLYSLGFMTLQSQYSTCGIVGINECLEILGYNILDTDGQDFTRRILSIINEENSKLEKKYKAPHNCEQVPGESSSVKLASADKLLGFNKKYSFYSNQFLPSSYNVDIIERLNIQGLFDNDMTGGAVCRLNFLDKITDIGFAKKIIRYAIKKGVIYHDNTYNIQECEDKHFTIGKSNKCTICGKDIVENYTRVVGFLVPVSNWNKVRREKDYTERKFYNSKDVTL